MAVLVTVLYAVPVLATAQPDMTPTITNIHVNRNLIVSTDVLIYGDYCIPYASLPIPPARDTYTFRVFENETEIGGITPYSSTILDKGYNHGVFGIYLQDEITWGNTYFLRLTQSPAYFDTPQEWDFPIENESYTGATSQADNQAEVTEYIMDAAARMESWCPTLTFTDNLSGGTFLAAPPNVGENYFRGAIDSLQFMAPDLFYIQAVSNNDLVPQEWTTAKFDEYEQRFNGTWVGNDTAATAEQFGGTKAATMAVEFTMPIAIGMVIFSLIKFKKVEPGFIAGSLVIIMGGMMGWFPTPILASLLQLAGIYLSYIFFFSRG